MLWKGAEALVSGAVAAATRLGVSQIVVGLTVVAMGTSAPEVAASIAAALRGTGDAAIGNVYGSNIANLALVGGLIALLRPVAVQKQTIMREVPAMIATALLLYPILFNLHLGRAESIALLALFVVLLAVTVHYARRAAKAPLSAPPQLYTQAAAQAHRAHRSFKMCCVLIILGVAGVALGADLAVRGAITIGQALGLSEAVIGLTIIALGTSLPELVTCIVASLKKADDISIGNLVGSNIFNTLLVVGAAGTARPFPIDPRLAGTDYWIMIAASAAFAGIALAGRRKIGRPGGLVLLAGYVGYLLYLFACAR